MKFTRFAARSAAWLATIAVAAGLVACSDDDPPVASVSGTAAVGVPLASASVSVQCAAGTALVTTTAANGGWTVSLNGGQTFPCFISVTGGSPTVTLHAVAQAEGSVNVTPLTDLILAAAIGGDPTAWFNTNMPGSTGNTTFTTALNAVIGKLPAAQAQLVASLKAAGYAVPSGDLMTVGFKPADGDAYDDLLEALKLSLADAGMTYAQLVASIAKAGTTGTVALPFTDEITAAEVAAMPQLNSATVTVTGGVAKMKTNASAASAIGAYVGSGTGNKAVLQLPGLAGMKLKDFKGLTMEVKANSGAVVGNPYVSLNMMIELDCTAAPLPSNATIAQMRERRRLLTFDTFYKYIQAEPGSISASAYSTVTMAPATGGWRISQGAADDNDTGLVEQGHEGANYTQETLQTFKYDQYPNACIVDGVSADAGLFRDTANASCATSAALTGSDPASCGKAHSGVFLFLGSSGNLSAGDWDVRKVKVNDRTFTFK